jgi:hypothetical protein
MSEKSKHSIDRNNNLSIEKNGWKLSPRGKFSAAKDNRLIYWLNEPAAWRRKYRLGKAFVFAGKWRLNANHDLELKLDKSELWQKNAVLVLKGDIVSPDKDKLTFQIKSKDSQGNSEFYFLKLGGRWQADKYNRINFVVKKSGEPADTLVLRGTWQVNRNQQIIYNYEKTNLKTKTKTTRSLTFSGYWQIKSTQRLTYIFLSDSRSQFDFRCQIESPNLYPAEGIIKYRLGGGLRKPRLSGAPRLICLYGTWKFSRKFELYFRMDYGRGRVQKILFGTQIRINRKNDIVMSLQNLQNEALGIQVIFTHKFLKKFDAQAFLRMEARYKGVAVKAGVRIPF